MKDVFSKETLLPLGLVITLLGAAMSFGVVYQKVNDLDRRVASVETKLDRLIELRVASSSMTPL